MQRKEICASLRHELTTGVSHRTNQRPRGQTFRLRSPFSSVSDFAGQAYVEFVIVLPLFLILIAGVVGFGQSLYTKLALEGAVWAGARHGVATLNPTRGTQQAYLGARYTLSGFGLNPDRAQVQALVWGQWGRGTQIQVRACYPVPSPPVPMGRVLAPNRLCAAQTMPVYQWKSRWP